MVAFTGARFGIPLASTEGLYGYEERYKAQPNDMKVLRKELKGLMKRGQRGCNHENITAFIRNLSKEKDWLQSLMRSFGRVQLKKQRFIQKQL